MARIGAESSITVVRETGALPGRARRLEDRLAEQPEGKNRRYAVKRHGAPELRGLVKSIRMDDELLEIGYGIPHKEETEDAESSVLSAVRFTGARWTECRTQVLAVAR